MAFQEVECVRVPAPRVEGSPDDDAVVCREVGDLCGRQSLDGEIQRIEHRGEGIGHLAVEPCFVAYAMRIDLGMSASWFRAATRQGPSDQSTAERASKRRGCPP